jgi:hypothetical protein
MPLEKEPFDRSWRGTWGPPPAPSLPGGDTANPVINSPEPTRNGGSVTFFHCHPHRTKLGQADGSPPLWHDLDSGTHALILSFCTLWLLSFFSGSTGNARLDPHSAASTSSFTKSREGRTPPPAPAVPHPAPAAPWILLCWRRPI